MTCLHIHVHLCGIALQMRLSEIKQTLLPFQKLVRNSYPRICGNPKQVYSTILFICNRCESIYGINCKRLFWTLMSFKTLVDWSKMYILSNAYCVVNKQTYMLDIPLSTKYTYLVALSAKWFVFLNAIFNIHMYVNVLFKYFK